MGQTATFSTYTFPSPPLHTRGQPHLYPDRWTTVIIVIYCTNIKVATDMSEVEEEQLTCAEGARGITSST